MDTTDLAEYSFSLIGGALCLDFANTAGAHATLQPSEYLAGYTALVAWGIQAGMLGNEEAAELLAAARQRPDDAGAVLAEARDLREILFRIFTAIATERQPEQRDLARFNARLGEAMRHLQVVPGTEGYSWTWQRDQDARANLARMLWPVVQSAGELLVGGNLRRVRTCANDTCGWLFLDTSKNRSRRWCDMNDCGNRAKARRHYARRKHGG